MKFITAVQMFITAAEIASLLAVGVSGDTAAYPAQRIDQRAVEAQVTGAPDMMKIGPSDTDASCVKPLMSIFAAAPTAPPALASYEIGHPLPDTGCHYPVPDSLTAAHNSYGTVLSEWYISHSGEISSAMGQCTGLNSGLFSAVSHAIECITVADTQTTSTTMVNTGGNVTFTVTAMATAASPTATTSDGTLSRGDAASIGVVSSLIIVGLIVAAYAGWSTPGQSGEE